MMDEASKKDELEEDDSFFNESKKSYYVFMIASVGILGGYLMM